MVQGRAYFVHCMGREMHGLPLSLSRCFLETQRASQCRTDLAERLFGAKPSVTKTIERLLRLDA